MRDVITRTFLTLLIISTHLAGAVTSLEIHVAVDGNDQWSGRRATADSSGTDGPLASLTGARDAIRRLKADGHTTQPIRVRFAPGTYTLTAPVTFTTEDSGTQACPISYEAKPATVTFTGGREISLLPDTNNEDLLTTEIEDVASGNWTFEQLYLDGKRLQRARTPNTGWFVSPEIVKDASALTSDTADIDKRALVGSLQDVAALTTTSSPLTSVTLVAYHSWETSRHNLVAMDSSGTMLMTGPAAWPFHRWGGGGQRYHLENYAEAVDKPGEWCLGLDGKLTLRRPNGSGTNTKVVAPMIPRFLEIRGETGIARNVAHLTFSGLDFEYSGYILPYAGHADSQAGSRLSAAIVVDHAHSVSFEDCSVRHTGEHGFWFRRGVTDSRIWRCLFEDLGAGGVRIGETEVSKEPESRTSANKVENNIIRKGGRIFPGAVGVWIGQSGQNKVNHNDISSMLYTGISVGWNWGYQPSVCVSNEISYNRIHDIGVGVLSDMGGIYTLGWSPGTVLRGNVIFNVKAYNRYGAGGWGIYNDEGSAYITVEDNLVYNTDSSCYHQHYGMANVVRNNIFAFGHEGQIKLSRPEPHLSFIFENNIVYWDKGPLLHGNWNGGHVEMRSNLFYATDERNMNFNVLKLDDGSEATTASCGLVANPRFENAENGDFRLQSGTPAKEIGFRPFDISKAGVYGDVKWRQNSEQKPEIPEEFQALTP